MKVDLNSLLTLGDGNFHITEIDGLGAADIRTSSFLFSGRDGGLVTDQFYGFRNIDIAGTIVSPTCDQHELDRAAFLEAIPINQNIPVYITTFAGNRYLVNCRVVRPSLKHLTGGQMSDFLLQLTAGDPLFYDAQGDDEQTAIVERVVENGGYDTPYDLPVDWEQGGAPTIVTNNGNAIYYPTITLTGDGTDPRLTNLATGESFELDLSVVPGDEIVIDMYNRTVTLNGSDIIGNKTIDSVWWGLLPGANAIALTSDSASDELEAEITWRNGVTGI